MTFNRSAVKGSWDEDIVGNMLRDLDHRVERLALTSNMGRHGDTSVITVPDAGALPPCPPIPMYAIDISTGDTYQAVVDPDGIPCDTMWQAVADLPPWDVFGSGSIKIVEDSPTGRPYVEFYNQNALGALVRKGIVGDPEPLSDTSDIYLRSDMGDVRLEAPAGDVYIDGLRLADPSVPPAANEVLRSSASGYTYLGWLNTVSGATTVSPTKIFVGTTTDNFLRYTTPESFRANVSADIKPINIVRAYDASGANGSTVTVTLPATLSGVSLAGATGVFGTVTAVPTASGYMTIFPYALASPPEGSNCNYAVGDPSPSSGYFFVALDTSRRFKVYRHGATRTILDVQGLIFG